MTTGGSAGGVVLQLGRRVVSWFRTLRFWVAGGAAHEFQRFKEHVFLAHTLHQLSEYRILLQLRAGSFSAEKASKGKLTEPVHLTTQIVADSFQSPTHLVGHHLGF
jgi:hypothetical protein